MKVCLRCKRTCSESEFHRDRSTPDGLARYCKQCNRASCLRWQRKHPVYMKEYRKKWYTSHPESVQRSGRKFRENHVGSWLILNARNRARLKELPFDLDAHREALLERANRMVCELTGIELIANGRKAYNSPSLDRISPKKGYIYSNVRIVCYAMNCALGTWGETGLRKVIDAWQGKR